MLALGARKVRGWRSDDGSGALSLDAGLYTGMRYVELQRFQAKGREWFDGKFVYLPTEAVLKHKRRQLERWVRLNPQGREAVEKFLACRIKLPSWWGWTDALRKWGTAGGLDPLHLSPKSTRKTWESWLMSMYPEHWMEVVQSQGHTTGTAMNHYLNMPFLPEDKAAMKPYTDGFF